MTGSEKCIYQTPNDKDMNDLISQHIYSFQLGAKALPYRKLEYFTELQHFEHCDRRRKRTD